MYTRHPTRTPIASDIEAVERRLAAQLPTWARVLVARPSQTEMLWATPHPPRRWRKNLGAAPRPAAPAAPREAFRRQPEPAREIPKRRNLRDKPSFPVLGHQPPTTEDDVRHIRPEVEAGDHPSAGLVIGPWPNKTHDCARVHVSDIIYRGDPTRYRWHLLPLHHGGGRRVSRLPWPLRQQTCGLARQRCSDGGKHSTARTASGRSRGSDGSTSRNGHQARATSAATPAEPHHRTVSRAEG